jgi:uncharacterized membrane protein (DUF2068 family)
MEPTTRARPTGVTILAVLAAIGGVLGLLAGVALLGMGGAATAAGATGLLASYGAIFGILAIAQGALALAFAYGAWTLQPWGWMLGVVAFGLSLALSVLNVVGGGNIGSQAVSILIGIAILYYLFTPAVKQAFGRA